MNKQKIFAVLLIAGFLYFLGDSLQSQTTFDNSNCKCCGEECIKADCCKNCVSGSSQGNSETSCANCPEAGCKDCCKGHDGCMKGDPSTGSGTKENCCNSGKCSMEKSSTGQQMKCCDKKQ